MKTYQSIKILFSILCSIGMISAVNAQDKDREIIIIEKTMDKDGNIISKNIKRNKGSYSEDEVQEMIDNEGDALPFNRSFDLEGMGFGEDLGSLFSPRKPSKPSLGVMLEADNGQLTVTSVVDRSGAASADIREGDKIISVDGLPVATVEDIKMIIDKHDAGQSLDVVVWRDGAELEKSVKLKSNTFGGRFGDIEFDFPGGRGFQFFGDGENIDLDSILSQFRGLGLDFDFDGFDMDQFRSLRGLGDEDEVESIKNDRPQLGLFIEDQATGVVVTEVIDDTPAAEAGVKNGDLITHIDDNIVASYRELSAWMNTKKVGDTAVITVKRGKKSIDLAVQF